MARQSRYRGPQIAAGERARFDATLFERHKARTTPLIVEVCKRVARSTRQNARILKLLRRLRTKLNKF